MGTLLDAAVDHRFAVSRSDAEKLARKEAANTGGVLGTVETLGLEANALLVIVRVSLDEIDRKGQAVEGRPTIRPRKVGALYLTWGELLHPTADLGHVVLLRPLRLTRGTLQEVDDQARVAIEVPRISHSVRTPVWIGGPVCEECNRRMPDARLTAMPDARFCTKCTSRKENSIA